VEQSERTVPPKRDRTPEKLDREVLGRPELGLTYIEVNGMSKRNAGAGEAGKRGSLPLLRLSGSGKVGLLSAALAGTALALYLLVVRHLPPVPAELRLPWWAIAIMFFMAEVLVVNVRFRRNAYAFSLSEIPLVIGLFTATPAGLVAGRLVGSLAALALHRRQSPLKLAFNLSGFFLESVLALLVFHAFHSGNPFEVLGWIATFLTTFAIALVADLTIGAAVSLSEGKMQAMFHGLAFGRVVSATNTSIGLIGVMILWMHPESAWLLTVPAAILFLAYRAYTGQRQQHESLEFLHESTRVLNRSLKMEAAASTLLAQARKMFRADIAEITLLPGEPDEDASITTLGPGEEGASSTHARLDPTEGVWARIASEEQAILLARPIQPARLRAHFAERGIRDAMVAPLRGGEGVVGMMLVANRRADVTAFDGEDLTLFEALTNHASVSLENARLVSRLEESLAHLTEMNRMKDDFVATVSHELRTPLTTIQGSVKTLLELGPSVDQDSERSLLEGINRQGERLHQLIEDLLVAAQIESRGIHPVISHTSLAGIAEQVAEDLRLREGDRSVVVHVDGDVPAVQTDGRRVHQIVANLAENAIKYSPPGRSLTLRVRPARGGGAISVQDQGAGVPHELRDRIFDRFYQVDQTMTRTVGGAGLGLYICRQLAEVIGGRVALERSDHRGSVFTLWVPAEPPARSIDRAGRLVAGAKDLPARAGRSPSA
jgi:signal transduction histidine kinase